MKFPSEMGEADPATAAPGWECRTEEGETLAIPGEMSREVSRQEKDAKQGESLPTRCGAESAFRPTVRIPSEKTRPRPLTGDRCLGETRDAVHQVGRPTIGY